MGGGKKPKNIEVQPALLSDRPKEFKEVHSEFNEDSEQK